MTYKIEIPYRGSPWVEWANTRICGKALACALVSLLSPEVWR